MITFKVTFLQRKKMFKTKNKTMLKSKDGDMECNAVQFQRAQNVTL